MKTQLNRAYEHEAQFGDERWLTQPLPGGGIRYFTWKEGMAEARRVAAYLRSLELPAGSRIAIMAKNNAWWFLADLAIWMAGHVSVPLYPILTPETIRQILEHSEAALVFVGKLDGFAAMEPGIPAGVKRVVLPLAPPCPGERWEDIVARTAPLSDSPLRNADELATIIYTSGTTGVPKGVMHSFASLCSAQGYIDELAMVRTDRMLSYLPLAHSLERTLVETTSLLVGFPVFFAESLDTFVEDLKRAQPTLFVSVPRLWQKFQAGVLRKMPAEKLARLLRIPIIRGLVRKKILKGLGLAEVRFAGSGSAPIPGEVIAWFRLLGLELLEGYGMTENSSYSHMNKPGHVRVGYVGSPQTGVEHKIDDSGEILVRSPGNMMGYYKEPGLTREVLESNGWLHTGDMGEIDAEGRLKITGRVKELFKTSKGKYVAPTPIENKLLLGPEIEMVCVTGANRAQPFAIVVVPEDVRQRADAGDGRAEVSTQLAALMKSVNSSLDHHERLDKIVVVHDPWTIENGMLTPSLKLKRAVIESRYAKDIDGWFANKEPVVWA